MGKTYRVGTRTSALALRQIDEVLGGIKQFYPYIEVDVIAIDTYGDKNKHIPISEIEGSDFFTREIDQALLRGDIDFAVHSAKDLPDNLREGLSIAAITDSIDSYDILVSKSGLGLSELPTGATIGTSSLRRKTQLRKFRSDFQILDIRGNIEERLELLDHSSPGNLDAIVIAAAGLIRLGLTKRITQRIPLGIIRPHPLQGALALVARSADSGLIKLLSAIDSKGAIPA